MESTYLQDLAYGPTTITVHATNLEQKGSTHSLTITRWERQPPEIRLPAIPPEIFLETYTLPIWVSDNDRVELVRLNGRDFPVQKQEATISLPLQLSPGRNDFRIQVLDRFHNTREEQITIMGLRRMYVQQDSTALVNEQGNPVGVLFKGTEVVVDGQTPSLFQLRRSEDHPAGFVAKHLLGPTPPDMYPPGLVNLQARIRGDRIHVTGYAYDDKQVQTIVVSGIRVTRTHMAPVEVIGYPVRHSLYFEIELMIQQEELFPVQVQVTDTAGKEHRQMIQPHL